MIIILEEKNCFIGMYCLYGGMCYNVVFKGIICECGWDFWGFEC